MKRERHMSSEYLLGKTVNIFVLLIAGVFMMSTAAAKNKAAVMKITGAGDAIYEGVSYPLQYRSLATLKKVDEGLFTGKIKVFMNITLPSGAQKQLRTASLPVTVEIIDTGSYALMIEGKDGVDQTLTVEQTDGPEYLLSGTITTKKGALFKTALHFGCSA